MNDNLLTLTDSYKYSHSVQYPPGTEAVYSYFESRGGEFPEAVFFGLQYILERYLKGQVVTREKIEEAAALCELHFGSPDLFNREGWEHILEKHDGYLPIHIKAVPEGTVVPNRNVLMTIENTDPKCWWLTNFLETLLVQVWGSTTVATNSREMKKIIRNALAMSDDPDQLAFPGGPPLIDFMLHDFGCRGVSCMEEAAVSGGAHLVNFLGTDTVPALMFLRDYYHAEMAGFSIPACYDDQTEILTPSGWVPFDKLKTGQAVAEYTEEGQIQFTQPSDYQVSNYEGDMIHFYTLGNAGRVDLMVTPNHRMIRKSLATGKLEVTEAQEASFSQKNVLPQAGTKTGDYSSLTDLDRLRIAFQADGSFPSRAHAYTGARTQTKPIRFSLKKKRKIHRLQEILKRLMYEYTLKPEKNKKGYWRFWISVPTQHKMSKQLDWFDLQRIDSTWCQEFIDEASHWDGQWKGNNMLYSSTIALNTDIMCAIGTLAGHRSSTSYFDDKRGDRQRIYTTSVCTSTNTRGGQGISKGYSHYNGKIYCVTVPSGMIVVRRNGAVAICGNSEHSTITSWGREGEEDAYRNMLEQYPTGLVAVVSDSWDIYRAVNHLWSNKLRAEVMEREGRVVIRPDSGDPTIVVPRLLEILDNGFGGSVNQKGYRVLNDKVRVIQGDGINRRSLKGILDKVLEKGYSAANLVFGSGGGLLRDVNRDTLKKAFKCSAVKVNGVWRDVYKQPATAAWKSSKKGRLVLLHNDAFITGTGSPYLTCTREDAMEILDVFEHSTDDEHTDQMIDAADEMETVFYNGEVAGISTLAEIRERARLG